MTDLPATPRAAMSLRQRMIEDMAARLLKPGTQRGYIRGCKRFAAFLKRSPDTATAEDIRLFQLHVNRRPILTHLWGDRRAILTPTS